MRIGIDITAAVTQGGGIGRYTRDLVGSLVKIDADAHYRLFSAKPPKRLPVSDAVPSGRNVTYRPSPLIDKWQYRLWYRLRLPVPVQLLTGAIDLYYSPDFVLPPLFPRVPSLVTVHDLSFVHYPETFTPPLVAYLNQVVPWSVRRATHVLADSLSTKKDLMAAWGVPEKKITVLYSGVSPRFQRVEAEGEITAVLNKYQIPATDYILSVGTLQPRKNYQMLIKAFRPIADRYPHHLVISGGKGWLFEEMLSEIEAQGLTGRVHFIGFVEDQDLPALYSGATLLAFPSLYEGFGLPLLEAMACGLPVVSSNSSSLPEVGQNTAVLIPPHSPELWTETLSQLLDHPAERAAMRRRGFEHIQQFTWARAAQQLHQLMCTLL